VSDPLFYILAVVAVILLGISKSGFIGIGVMALPLMSLFVPPMQAAAIILPAVLIQDVLTVWVYRREWSAWNVKLMLPSMAVGLAIAALFAASLSAAHVRLAVGLIAGAFVLRHWVGERSKVLAVRPNTMTALVFGTIGGFTTMLANAGGPAWQMHLLPQRLDKFAYAATFSLLFAASDVLKIPALAALGQLTRENLVVGAMLLPVAIISNFAGIWLLHRTSADLFFRIAYLLMFAISIELVRGALAQLLFT
jgi:uncharacterized membrane protein YfcA